MAWSIAAYLREHNEGSMESLTLLPCGDDKSVIIHHLPSWLDFGWCRLGWHAWWRQGVEVEVCRPKRLFECSGLPPRGSHTRTCDYAWKGDATGRLVTRHQCESQLGGHAGWSRQIHCPGGASGTPPTFREGVVDGLACVLDLGRTYWSCARAEWGLGCTGVFLPRDCRPSEGWMWPFHLQGWNGIRLIACMIRVRTYMTVAPPPIEWCVINVY